MAIISLLAIDDKFNPRQCGHDAVSIIKQYSKQSEAFNKIETNEEDVELVKNLEKAWLVVRYFEASLYSEGKDLNRAIEMSFEFADEFHRMTGARILPDHFHK